MRRETKSVAGDAAPRDILLIGLIRGYAMTTISRSRISGRARAWALAALFVCSGLCPGAVPVPGGGASAQPAAPVAPPDVAPVVLDGRTLAMVGGVSAYTAKERAGEIAARIEAVAADAGIAVQSVRRVEAGDRTNIVAGDRLLMSVVDTDAELERAGSRQIVAEVYAARFAKAIEQYRVERSAAYLERQALRAALALAVIVVLLVAGWRAFSMIERASERHFAAWMEALEERSYNLLTVEQLRGTVKGGIRALRVLFVFVVAFAGVDYALGLFPWTRPAAEQVTDLVIDPLRTMGNALLNALPGLVFIAILVVVTRYVLRLVQLFFGGIASGRIRFSGFAPEWAWPTYRLVRVAIIAFAVVISYPYIPGSSSEAFKGVSIFLGLLMSLGAASAVANSLAGYTLIYRRSFRLGDRIRVNDLVGDVIEMRQQATHLKTPKNEEITIPSSSMLTSSVINYSSLARRQGLILHTTVGIGYETPWRQVEAMLKLAASRTPGLMPEPPPFVLVKSLGDFCVVYEINGYCDKAQAMEATYAEMYRNILDVFNEYGVQIMTPAYVHDPEVPKLVPKDQWFVPPARPPAPASP
jgi:small-conductance mechanosensitive channel